MAHLTGRCGAAAIRRSATCRSSCEHSSPVEDLKSSRPEKDYIIAITCQSLCLAKVSSISATFQLDITILLFNVMIILPACTPVRIYIHSTHGSITEIHVAYTKRRVCIYSCTRAHGNDANPVRVKIILLYI